MFENFSLFIRPNGKMHSQNSTSIYMYIRLALKVLYYLYADKARAFFYIYLADIYKYTYICIHIVVAASSPGVVM